MTEGARMTRVIVVDDQAVVREGLVLLLGLLPDIEVVGSAGDGEAALRLVGERRPDVVLMDLRMPRMDGVEATARIRAEFPGTQVVVLTTYSDDESVFAALRAGARGFLTKDADADDIARAVATVKRGDAQLDPTVQRRLLDTMSVPPRQPPATTGNTPPPPPGIVRDGLPDGLTPREGEVLALIADGLSNTEIAARLYISEATVKTHINNLFAKAGLRDRAQAVSYAFRHGVARPQ
ncbi:response regulator transcription factor [Nonomuraea jabiensis]|uniref:DNA-binding NarL/FixJ family response regulator n=1 Tax=Nonomuraea jabiensis TaxID=882448 RepID=A0A7W9G791_9ACTN|nr:response regulator transcription factor [Nonomuraea jabiensis]MBB5778488.1 DNA-binding NarL/FixJ family response regulator [Nonomuraea jabiensis]